MWNLHDLTTVRSAVPKVWAVAQRGPRLRGGPRPKGGAVAQSGAVEVCWSPHYVVGLLLSIIIFIL